MNAHLISKLQDTSNGINLIPFKGRGGVESHPTSSAQDVGITSVLLEREPQIPAALKTGQTFWMNRKLTVCGEVLAEEGKQV